MDRLSKVPNVRKNTSKLTYIFLKLRKCGAKHATSTDQKFTRVSTSEEGGGGESGGIPPLPEKLACPSQPPLLCPKNADFIIFMQFLAILPKLSPQPVDLI